MPQAGLVSRVSKQADAVAQAGLLHVRCQPAIVNLHVLVCSGCVLQASGLTSAEQVQCVSSCT